MQYIQLTYLRSSNYISMFSWTIKIHIFKYFLIHIPLINDQSNRASQETRDKPLYSKVHLRFNWHFVSDTRKQSATQGEINQRGVASHASYKSQGFRRKKRKIHVVCPPRSHLRFPQLFEMYLDFLSRRRKGTWIRSSGKFCEMCSHSSKRYYRSELCWIFSIFRERLFLI